MQQYSIYILKMLLNIGNRQITYPVCYVTGGDVKESKANRYHIPICLATVMFNYRRRIFPLCNSIPSLYLLHDDVIKWKHFPRNWPFVREIHRSPVNFPHKGQWRGALMFSLIYAWINDWVNNREAGDLRRQHGHYDVIVMLITKPHLARLIFICTE